MFPQNFVLVFFCSFFFFGFFCFFFFIIFFVESKSKKYRHDEDSSSSETETESETQFQTESDSESDDDNDEYVPTGSVRTSGRKSGKKNSNRSKSKSKNKNKSKTKTPNKNKNKITNKSKNKSKTNSNDYTFGQSIAELNEILREEIDVDGEDVNLEWHQIVEISAEDQIRQFGKVLAQNNCYRPAGTRAEYKQDPLAINNSYSEETNTYLKKNNK